MAIASILKWSTLVGALAVFTWYLLPGAPHFDVEAIRGQRILITGASSGIGEQLAYEYAKLGARILITARRRDLLAKVAAECRRLGAAGATFVIADMANVTDRKEVVRETEATLGGLDRLILNHAVVDIRFWTGSDDDLSALQYALQVNFLSHVDLFSQLLPLLRSSTVGGAVGVVSSVYGKVGSLTSSVYSSGKFAMHGFFSALRLELLASNTSVSVTMLVFGLVKTDAAVELLRDSPTFSYQQTGHLWGDAREAALVVVRGVALREREVYYPTVLSAVAVTVHKFMPGWLEDYLTQSMGV